MSDYPAKKPAIAEQVDRLCACVRRMCHGEYLGVLCLGPPGVGKTIQVEAAFHAESQPFQYIQDATKAGLLLALRANPRGNFFLDDFAGWLDEDVLALLKSATAKRPVRMLGAVNANTMKRTDIHVPFYGRIVINANDDPDRLPAKARRQVRALADRMCPVRVSWNGLDRLEYIDWQLCSQDYFRSRLFWQTERIPPLSLREIEDVIRFIHTHAWQLELSLRTVNDVARERKLHPAVDWAEQLRGLLRPPTKVLGHDGKPMPVPPPPPPVLGWNQRHGLPSKPPRQARLHDAPAIVEGIDDDRRGPTGPVDSDGLETPAEPGRDDGPSEASPLSPNASGPQPFWPPDSDPIFFNPLRDHLPSKLTRNFGFQSDFVSLSTLLAPAAPWVNAWPCVQETGFVPPILVSTDGGAIGGHTWLERSLAAAPANLADPDDVPEAPAQPVSRPGDLWIMGPHRLLVGDSRSLADVMRLMDGKRAALVGTSPQARHAHLRAAPASAARASV